MAEPLGKVTRDLDVPRGPDVVHRIEVPRDWRARGLSVGVELPRNLHCAACGGGGCDACLRSGAVSLRHRQDPPESIEVTLPKLNAGEQDVCLRIPERGGLSAEEGLGRGHLLLTVRIAAAPSAGVSIVETTPLGMTDEERLALMKRSLIIVAALILLFVLLLQLAGWL